MHVHSLGRAAWRAIWTDGAREVWVAGWKCAVLHSGDGGTHFETMAPPCSAVGPAGVPTDLSAVWASGPDDVYLTGARVFHTTDRGKSWADVTPAPPAASEWHVWGSDADNVYGVGAGMWRSTDHGQTWKRIGEPAPSARADSFGQILGFSPADLYVVTEFGKTILHSIDDGATWEPRRSPSPVDGCCELRATIGAPEIYAVGTHHAFFRSGDEGRSWRRIVTPLGPRTRFDVMIRHHEALFALAADAEDGAQHTALLRSSDHGATWQLHSTLPYGMSGLAAIGDDLLAAGWGGMVLRLIGAATSPQIIRGE